MTPQAEANLAPKKPILSRDAENLPNELKLGTDLPGDLDPLADGILMAHQTAWLEDKSDLKIAEKGRRTGITFAEALDCAITASTSRTGGGDNVFYIGDTKDKGREFISYVSHFLKVVAGELAQIEEYVFKDLREDGTSKDISAYRITCASGFRVEALSSNPANIRGLQGVVVIDEAAFHRDVREVIDAVNALLIWGGKVRVISTHNGVLNPFNELIREAKAGKNGFKVHPIPFSKAVENGLFKRVCLIKDKKWSQEAQDAWEKQIRSSYGSRTAAMAQELDAIPAESEGAALTRVQIEACTRQGIPFHRWAQPDEFKNKPDDLRKRAALEWCEKHLKPVLDTLNQNGRHVMGEDFARSGDATDIVIQEITETLVRETKLLVELRNIPFDQQRDILYYICDRLPNFVKGALDKTGNGAYLAEKATQRYGGERIIEVSLSREWYAREMPPYIEAFGDKTIVLVAHVDVVQDHQSLQFVGGIIKVPDDFRIKGSDGLNRHGDSAIASALAFYASNQPFGEIDYRAVKRPQEASGMAMTSAERLARNRAADHAARSPWAGPLGTRIRGGI
ncbi:hypothetical protein PXK01_16630 [Phaeobacter sp. PT47_59]|uniref:hypothetical protein n=1 Tax=Phaeobacter sp. PT47_59 TaxID=3029979 RepID=UPI0023807998|nr:hypothetical protein [Phaeobacter sp. PT47_59]MDE4175790.1 hypothetical protein [Phaeobacter sp. PT47_59]